MVSTTHEEGPRRGQQRRPSTSPNPMHALLQDTGPPKDSAQGRRIAALRGVGAAYHHLKIRGLVSTVVVDELQRCLRDAA